MRKSFFILFLLFIYTWSWSIFNVAKADDYNTAVISHVISEKIKGTNIDTSYIMEQEIEKLDLIMFRAALTVPCPCGRFQTSTTNIS